MDRGSFIGPVLVGLIIIGVLYYTIKEEKQKKEDKKKMFQLWKTYKRYKRNDYSDFWDMLEKEDLEFYRKTSSQYNEWNKIIDVWDRTYPKIVRRKAGGFDKERQIYWDGYKEVEIWDD